MKPLEEELLEAEACIRNTPDLNGAVEQLSQFITTYIVEAIEGQRTPSVPVSMSTMMAAKMAMKFLGHEGIQDLVRKNMFLFAARLLSRIEAIDKLSTADKWVLVVRFINSLVRNGECWQQHLNLILQQSHDKKERRNKRHGERNDDKQLPQKTAAKLCSSAVCLLLPILLPSGAFSLYLPTSGSFFRPMIDETISSWMKKEELLERTDHLLRELKIQGLYALLSYFEACILKPERHIPNKISVSLNYAEELVPLLPRLKKIFAPIPVPEDLELDPLTVAKTATSVICSSLETFSFQKTLISATQQISSIQKKTEADLENLVERLSHNENVARYLLHLSQSKVVLPEGAPTDAISMTWNMIVDGLTSSVSDFLLQEEMSSYPWEEAQREVLDRLRWFILSPHFDLTITDCINS